MRGEGFSADQIDFELELFVQSEPEGLETRLEAESDFYEDPHKVAEVMRIARRLTEGNSGREPGSLALIMVCLVARAEVPHFRSPEVPPASDGEETARKGTRSVVLDQHGQGHDTPVFDRSLLTNGHNLVGPALIESEQTTLLVPPDWRLHVDGYDNAVLEEVPGK
jgi:N-methylhydantoinase A/oxoprolinase/acetone carboxylase beta subunit